MLDPITLAPRPAAPPGTWYAEDWTKNATSIMEFDSSMVWQAPGGGVSMSLGAAPAGSAFPYWGSSVQSVDALTTGTFAWAARVPDMVDGAVWGMFAYRADHDGQPWLEFDFEFVGGDTTQVQLAVHMDDGAGGRTSQVTDGVIDLWFDASQGTHTYETVVLGDGVVFRIDGIVVGYFSAHDMPDGEWSTGALTSHVELWAVDDDLAPWAGEWDYPGAPLTGTLAGAEVRPGDLGGAMPLLGGAGRDTVTGTAGRDVLDGLGGDDRLDGGAGDDRAQGGYGNDTLVLGAGDDWIDGGSGVDWLRVGAGGAGATVDLTIGRGQATGFGTDTIRGIENLGGGPGANKLYGDARANVIEGGAGDDTLSGRAGADTLVGGAGRDTLVGGEDRDRDVFVFGTVADSALGPGRDMVVNLVQGVDDIDLRGIDANGALGGDQAFRWGGATALPNGLWCAPLGTGTLVSGDVNGDRVADFEIFVAGATGLKSADFLL